MEEKNSLGESKDLPFFGKKEFVENYFVIIFIHILYGFKRIYNNA